MDPLAVEFGTAVALLGNLVAVTAPHTVVGSASNAGAVYLYRLPLGGAAEAAVEYLTTLALPNPVQNDEFGAWAAVNVCLQTGKREVVWVGR